MEKRLIKTSAAVFVATMLMVSLAGCGKSKTIESGSTWEVAETTKLSSLTIADGAAIKAPEGYSVTLTVDGVETGQVLKTWEGVDYKFAPGAYKGDIVLTVSKANHVVFSGMGGGAPEGGAPGAGGAPGGGAGGGMPEGEMAGGAGGFGGGMPDFYPFRQALYLDKDGIDYDKSVLAAVQGEKPEGFDIENIRIESKGSFYKNPTSPGGTGFNGIYAAGGEYNIKNVEIDFFGDGRSDFVGAGTAIVADGMGTRLVLDNVTINNQGVVRSAVIPKGGSKVIVKNSKIATKGGVLPPFYAAGANISQMRSTLWISGMTGTNRATSLLGTGTEATYINTSISFEGWGGLSTDIGKAPKLTAINCKVNNTGNSGYGSYCLGAIIRILGSELNIKSIVSAASSGSVFYGDSTREAVAALNEELGLGLTAEELKSIPVKPTIINSDFLGFQFHSIGGAALTITGGTIVNTKEEIFNDKGAYTDIQVDGSKGVQLNPGNGVIMQVMDNDEPPQGSGETNDYGTYEEPTGPVTKDESHDIYIAKDTDALAKFSNIELKGDFYNSARGGQKNNPMGGGIISISRNLGLTFNNASITGVITASDAYHFYNGKYYPKIGKDESLAFSRVINTPGPAINNGVIVNLTNGSNWIVTGTSYLTKLVLDSSSSVTAGKGSGVSMTVNDAKRDIEPGHTYTGAIVVSVK